ncbi:MAG: hypothetical protein JXR60_06665 [Bacteroidales bacterium]|nr:hypothetical protein [Bacteroidales bacterium]
MKSFKTKIQNLTVLFTLLVFINGTTVDLYAQKYSIDKEQKVRKQRKPLRLKYLFKKDASKAAAKQVKKDEKHKAKVLKKEQKLNREYQKKANNNNEKGKDRKVYKRMRQYEKEAKRRRDNKPNKNWFQRLFNKDQKKKRKKE